MAKSPRTYGRLTRPLAGLAAYSSLWYAADHLLLVKSNGYRERYQRFQFGDIQAVLVAASNVRANWSIAWGLIALISGLFVVLTTNAGGVPVFSLGFAAIALVCLGVNLALGPTCKVILVTRVQTVPLPIRRRRKADSFLERITPLIEAAQADLRDATDAIPTAPPRLA